jgi:hypothetical protein
MYDYGSLRFSSFALWARRLGWFNLVLLVVAGAGHRYGHVDTISFLWLLGLVGLIVAVTLVLAALGFAEVWNEGHRGARAVLSALLAGLLTASIFIWAGYAVITRPMLNEVSTDLTDPPRFSRLAAQRVGPMNPIPDTIGRSQAALQLEAYPEVAGRRYEASLDQVMEGVEAVAARRGWQLRLLARGPVSIELEAEVPTFLLRFPVDAAFRLVEQGATVIVDMRMNSRYGRHDLGDGAARIARFMADLDTEMTALLSALEPQVESGEDEDAVE